MNQERRDTPPRPVRNRTLHHMRKLLADTAVAGAALHLSGGCFLSVDPLPPPLDCTADLTGDTLDDWLYWQSRRARWIQTEDELRILVELGVWDAESKVSISGEPTLEGATLLESQTADTSMTFTCIPVDGATSAAISFPIRCEDIDHTLQLIMDVSGTPQLGERVPISPAD
ncbi:MAG: hypothetical protein JSU63_07160 [Phycisphaerales bacterium]|nr:MAG: hypothetical protein JSU63_07160 [Phycisphaerales bacterium]